MEFDKSRVYTALNAEDLPIGSKCIFSDTIQDLRIKVRDAKVNINTLTNVIEEAFIHRFSGNNNCDYLYAYLIELPAEPKYKPFESIEKAMEAIQKHGGWVKKPSRGTLYILVEKEGNICLLEIENQDRCITSNDLFKDFVFADDDSPCGELVEE